MKIFFLSLIFVTKVFAGEISELPTYLCDDGRCSASQEKILSKFIAGKEMNLSRPAVFSGKCFHLDDNYDGKFAHYGVIFLVPHEGEVFWDGTFAFFENTNPYKLMNVNKAFEVYGHIEENSKNHLEKIANYHFANFGTEENFMRYWFRVDNKSEKIELISMWGISHRMTCELVLNK